MISFVWSSKYPFISGSGGSENYTAGQVRELMKRGIDCRILLLSGGITRSRKDFPDITFQKLNSKEELATLDETVIFITYALNVKTKNQSYVILHCPPPSFTYDPLYDLSGLEGKKMIAVSHFAAGMWARYYFQMKRTIPKVSVVHPFAEPSFAKVKRPVSRTNKPRILFAGRLIPDKGIYTLLTALHLHEMKSLDYRLTVTTAGSNTYDGRLLKKMLEVNKKINLVPAKMNPSEMAELIAANDIVVMPTTDIFWKESFGIISVESQHAGCRIVASKAGGLPETDCGGMIKVKADDPLALAKGMVEAAKAGPLTPEQRLKATKKYTVQKSVDSLLKVIGYSKTSPQTRQPRKAPALFHAPIMYRDLKLKSPNSKVLAEV